MISIRISTASGRRPHRSVTSARTESARPRSVHRGAEITSFTPTRPPWAHGSHTGINFPARPRRVQRRHRTLWVDADTAYWRSCGRATLTFRSRSRTMRLRRVGKVPSPDRCRSREGLILLDDCGTAGASSDLRMRHEFGSSVQLSDRSRPRTQHDIRISVLEIVSAMPSPQLVKSKRQCRPPACRRLRLNSGQYECLDPWEGSAVGGPRTTSDMAVRTSATRVISAVPSGIAWHSRGPASTTHSVNSNRTKPRGQKLLGSEVQCESHSRAADLRIRGRIRSGHHATGGAKLRKRQARSVVREYAPITCVSVPPTGWRWPGGGGSGRQSVRCRSRLAGGTGVIEVYDSGGRRLMTP